MLRTRLLNIHDSSTFTERVSRSILPTFDVGGPGLTSEMGPALALTPRDLALFTGHPAGMSPRRAADRLRAPLWEAFPAQVALLDATGVIVSVNRAWEQYGLENGDGAARGLGHNYLDVCARASAAGEAEAEAAADLIRAALAGDDTGRRLSYHAGPGGEHWFSLQAVPIPGRDSGALVVHRDVTHHRRGYREWQRRAMHDPLTGLPNRALLADRLDHAVAGAARVPVPLTVLFIGLDGFRSATDGFGYSVEDEVVRAADTVGRWGGDEFLVIAGGVGSNAGAEELAGRVRRSLDEPLQLDRGTLAISASTGMANLEFGGSADLLLRAAGRDMQELRRSRAG
jgi:diguanylate cyclase (GGDEF)-like protein